MPCKWGQPGTYSSVSQLPQVWGVGGQTPASFAEGAFLFCLDGGDVNLEVWPAQSPKRLSHRVWTTYRRNTVSQPQRMSRLVGALCSQA